MKTFQTTNPFTGNKINEYKALPKSELIEKIESSNVAFQSWRLTTFEERSLLFTKLSSVLRANADKYARIITAEMGKPFKEAVAEIEKCAWVCEYYADNAKAFLKDEVIDTEADSSYVKYQPLGTVFAIMPWNYPFWQVFRFAVPALMAGNAALLKHAPNVFGSAAAIAEAFTDAEFPKDIFQSLVVDIDLVETIVGHPAVKGVALTGSEVAGASVASLAGRNLKRTVLELGGSNAFVVLDDADLKEALAVGLLARMQNSGQSCIAAKRFILHEKIADEFLTTFTEKVKELNVGDPMDESTKIGPLARVDLAEKLESQVKKSIAAGAKLVVGGQRENATFYPGILSNVKPGMPAFDEELFGPMAAVIVAKDDEDALRLANNTHFGLGMSVFTSSEERALYFVNNAEDGAVFVNGLVKSDPRLPFGGTKRSGYGRELSLHGIREFVNVKTVHIKGIK